MFVSCWFVLAACVSGSAVTHRQEKWNLQMVISSHGSRTINDQSSHAHDISIDPVSYVHIPKTGSGIATAVAHLLCGDKIRKGKIVKEPDQRLMNRCGPAHFQRFDIGHKPLKPGVDLSKVVTVLRQPRQRIISGYFHSFHDCRPLQRKYNFSVTDSTPKLPMGSNTINSSLLMEYADCVQACAINIITGHWCSHSDQDPSEQIAQAIDTVNKIGYVGITEQWELSICLFHAMYGGECLPAEFERVRPGLERKDTSDYDESAFGDWFPDDQLLYNVARKRFEQQMIEYNVNRHSCATRYCPKARRSFGYAKDSTISFLSAHGHQSGPLSLARSHST